MTSVGFSQFMSPIGKIAVFATSSTITRVMLDPLNNSSDETVQLSALKGKAQAQLLEYFNGTRRNFDLPLDWESIRGFQKDVLQLTFSIPFGEVRTYGQLATQLHKPGSARAVGTALARNPLPILIPCHRVVASNGHLTGYLGSKGIATKQWLLEREGHKIVDQKLG